MLPQVGHPRGDRTAGASVGSQGPDGGHDHRRRRLQAGKTRRLLLLEESKHTEEEKGCRTL